MSDDLVKRLREDQPVTQDFVSTMQCALQDAAADRIEKLETLLWAADYDAKEAETYAGELEAENRLLKTSGIGEVAARNPSVMEYMKHWEGRAEAAGAKLAKAVEALAWHMLSDDFGEKARTTITELTGGMKDD